MKDSNSNVCTHQGKNIEFWRNFNRLNQRQLGEMVDLAQNKISQIERMEEIDEETMQKIADALGVDIQYLKSCDHDATLKTCKGVINYFIATGAKFIQENNGSNTNIDHQVNYPVDKITELYERIILLEKENTELRSKIK